MASAARPAGVFGASFGRRFLRWQFVVIAVFVVSPPAVAQGPARAADFLGDKSAGISMTHHQQWGDFGVNVAAAASGGTGAPLRIGEKTYDRGLGHHANGEIVVDLQGQYQRFRALVGVQWQGGDRGSVTFRIAVDGKTVFEAGPMSDSDPAKEVEVPLAGARELRLIANDSGNGIGCDMANWVEASLERDPNAPFFGKVAVSLSGSPAPPASPASCGFSLVAGPSGPQLALMEPAGAFTVSVDSGEEVRLTIPAKNLVEPVKIVAEATVLSGGEAEVEVSLGTETIRRKIEAGGPVVLQTPPVAGEADTTVVLTTRGVGGEAGVRWRGLRFVTEGRSVNVPLLFPAGDEAIPPPVLPDPRPAIERELVEWDWRMQDGIGTERESRTWQEAVETVLKRGDQLIQDLKEAGVGLGGLVEPWEEARAELGALSAAGSEDDSRWEDLWRRIHVLRRRIALANPLADVGPLAFVKRVPSGFSHQLTQYGGRCARPGGGVFVLEAPGESMRCRQLASLPTGSPLHLDVSCDGRRLLFSFCEIEPGLKDWRTNDDQHYHLFEVDADGSNLRQLTDGPYDDFSPRYLPDGKILFLSTRRGGFHRCGRGPCPVYTMAVANGDGSDPRVISFHETHEWDPAVLNDGRVIYTRWDYVDRHAVHYQQLWTVRPDGTNVRAFYGNNTFNPVGVWEARSVPGSPRVMATAAAHHAMTAGSIILLDVTRGIDGLDPITRLTPDVLFPESESRVERWHNPVGVSSPPPVPEEERRWPGHCYRTPYPLSEDYFLAAYSFDPLIGEPFANKANMFGIYLVDRFGNKELLYRDVSIGSLWPMPLEARQRPPVLPSTLAKTDRNEGTFFVQNVNESWPKLPRKENDTIRGLRIVQVLPKTTPNANTPKVGLANASPGKQVLGTVPVEADGSAYFRAPAGIPLLFQALDEKGMAVQTMRSLTYLQPGEQATCIGCHEHRASAPTARPEALAKQRPPSPITPGPDGSKPLSYPILVQSVIDKHCVECHSGPEPDGKIVLTGAPAGAFSASYNALAPLVAFSEWKSPPQANAEPLTQPGRFGARGSKLTELLLEGHEGVSLSDEEMDRLVTWMDANALFYGTFDPEDQRRQQLGERIAGPALE